MLPVALDRKRRPHHRPVRRQIELQRDFRHQPVRFPIILAKNGGGWGGDFQGVEHRVHLGRDGGGRMSDMEDKESSAPKRNYRSEEETSELQSLMRISYAVFCLNKKNTQ